MINIKNVPLLSDDNKELNDILSTDEFGGYYFVRPKYSLLPNFDNVDDKYKHPFSDMEEGIYLSGIEIISDKYICKAFSNALFEKLGMILDEAYPVEMKDEEHRVKTSMICLKFIHVSLALKFYSRFDGCGFEYKPEIKK